MRMAAKQLDSTDRGYQLVRDLIESVETRLRVPSAWNGVVYTTPSPSRMGRAWNGGPDPLHDWDAVTANADHSLTVRADLLRHALKAQTSRLDVRENFEAHQSVLRMVHEAVILSRHDLTEHPQPSHREDEASDMLTIGLARDWALPNTNTVITDIDLNTRNPRLTASRVVDGIPHATAAAHRFVSDLAQAARRPRDVTHRELVSTHPTQRWNQIADWLIDSNLQGLIRPEQRDQVRSELADIAHKYYAEVAGIPDRVADMPAATPTDRVALAGAYRRRGGKDGESTLLRLNIHIKGLQVSWGGREDATDPVQRAARDLGIPVEKLQSLLDSSPSTGSTTPQDTTRPAPGQHSATPRRPTPGTAR
jgi:hypothetical protein